MHSAVVTLGHIPKVHVGTRYVYPLPHHDISKKAGLSEQCKANACVLPAAESWHLGIFYPPEIVERSILVRYRR